MFRPLLLLIILISAPLYANALENEIEQERQQNQILQEKYQKLLAKSKTYRHANFYPEKLKSFRYYVHHICKKRRHREACKNLKTLDTDAVKKIKNTALAYKNKLQDLKDFKTKNTIGINKILARKRLGANYKQEEKGNFFQQTGCTYQKQESPLPFQSTNFCNTSGEQKTCLSTVTCLKQGQQYSVPFLCDQKCNKVNANLLKSSHCHPLINNIERIK